MTDVDPIRIEEAGLNAVQTRRQLFFDGWLLRRSPGKAKRARSVNPQFGSSLPLAAKIDRCEVSALALHRKFGFETIDRNHYRARPDECR